MLTRIFFDVAALPVFLIILSTALSRGMTRGRSNRLFLVVVTSSCIAGIAEIGEHLAYLDGFPIGSGKILWATVCEYVYFTARNFTPVAYLFFVYSMTRTWYRIRPLWKKAVFLLPFMGILISLVLDMAGVVSIFEILPESGYVRGDHILLIYFFATFYMVYGALYLLRYKKAVDLSVWMALMSMYVLNVVAVLIQFFFSRVYIEIFFSSLTMIFVVMFIQRPETQADPDTGVPGYRAFCSEINKIKAVGHDVSIVTIVMKNARGMYHYIGESRFNAYIHLIADEIRAYTVREKLFCELFYEYPGIFHAILEDTEFNPAPAIAEIKETVGKKSQSVLRTGARPDTRVASVLFPSEIPDTSEVLRFAHNFLRYANVDKIYTHARDIVGRREYQIEAHMDEVLDRAIEKHEIKSTFSSVWSCADGRVFAGLAGMELEDEQFGIIDEALLTEAAAARGLTIRVGNHMLEQVFMLAGSDEFNDRGYSYILVPVSVDQCMQMDFTDMIWQLREKYGAHPEHICFCIKESAFENSSVVLEENIKKLSVQGYGFALDGYGRGYTNVRYILDLPIRLVIIDETMTQGMDINEGWAILEGSIRMLKNIPLKVMVPGVKDKEVADRLMAAGCDYLAGPIYE